MNYGIKLITESKFWNPSPVSTNHEIWMTLTKFPSITIYFTKINF